MGKYETTVETPVFTSISYRNISIIDEVKTRFTLFVDMVCYLSQFVNAIVDLLHCY